MRKLAAAMFILWSCSDEDRVRDNVCDPGSAEFNEEECSYYKFSVKIPASDFMMGCNEEVDSECEGDEKPDHGVTVPEFFIDVHEVTAAEYVECVDTGPCSPANSGENCNYGVSGRENHPVNCVDWNQAKDYCEWKGGRLPTEAEWEKAARAGTASKYACGNDASCLDRIAWYSENSGGGTTHPVKEKAANDYGLYDMYGNVWEWVSDWYHDSYDGAPSDGSAWEDPAGSYRVLRGGSWNFGTWYLRASNRTWDVPGYWSGNIGFRCVRD